MEELEYDSSDDDSDFSVVVDNMAWDTDMELGNLSGDEVGNLTPAGYQALCQDEIK